jgi:hypothetical protein
MGYPGRKLENDEIDPKLLDAVASKNNELNADGAKNIQEIRKELAEEMKKARMDGILNEKDVMEFDREIQRNSADQKGIVQVAGKVKSVIAENKELLDSFVKGLTSDREIDQKLDVEDHIRQFKALSTEEKKKYVTNLGNNLAWVNKLYQEVKKYAPEKADQFRVMTGKEKKAFVEELRERVKNTDKYQELIAANREHFSKESEHEYMTQFKELKTVAEQEQWIRDFSKEIERKGETVKKFKAFPVELQVKFPQFFEARRNQRNVILQNMERTMEEDHLNTLNNDPNAKHFSEKDRAEAIKWWKQASIPVRTAMLKNLPEHLKKTAALGQKYEAMSDVVKLDVQKKLDFTSFYDLNFEQKTKAVEAGQKLAENGDKLTAGYEAKLKDAVAKKYMGKATLDSFMKEFKEQADAEKTDWVNKFETHELPKRQEITEKFQKEVPKEEQDNNAQFYEMGYSDRVKLLAKLLGISVEQADVEKPSSESAEKDQRIEHMSTQAMTLERAGSSAADRETKKDKWGKAIQLYGKILDVAPDDEIAQANYDRLVTKFTQTFPNEVITETDDDRTMDTHLMDELLEKASGGSTMEEKRKRLTIVKNLQQFEESSELRNANTFDATQKTARFSSQFERDLNSRLAEHSGGDIMLDRDGKGREIRKVDARRINSMNASDVFKLQREVVQNRGEKSKKVDHIQMYNQADGKLMNSSQSRVQVEKLENELRSEAARRAAQVAEARGRKLNKEELKALEKRAANTNMEVDLQQTG